MVNRKCLICKSTVNTFPFPTGFNSKRKWTDFVKRHCPMLTVWQSSCLCADHFAEDCFTNYSEWEKKIVQKKKTRLRLLPTAVPSLIRQISPHREETEETQPLPCLASSMEPSATVTLHDIETENEKQDDDPIYEPHLEFDGDDEEDEEESTSLDQSYSKHSFRADNGTPWAQENFIVPWTFLLTVLSICRKCGKQDVSVQRTVVGAALIVTVQCHDSACSYTYTKSTSEKMDNNKIYLINYLLSCAILFAGGFAKKVFRVFSFANIHTPSERTFFRHQKTYLWKAIREVWSERQADLVREIRQDGSAMILAGDGRCDSMGHSAKYGCYTLIDTVRNKILTLNLIQTTGNSNAMEMIGFKLCLQQVFHWNFTIDTFVSDRHIQIRAFMRDTYGVNRKPGSPEIKHCLDIWHVAKGLKKDLKAAAKKDDSGRILEWSKATTNHLYWVAASTPTDTANWSDMVESKWRSLGNHIVNIHRHGNDEVYESCEHPRRRRGEKKKKYMKKNTPEHELMTDIIGDKRRLKDVRQLSPEGQTSSLEAFHSVVNHFAPKMLHFPYEGMNARLDLAAIHYNSNSDYHKDNEEADTFTITYPKFKKGEPTVRKRSKHANYDYVNALFRKAFQMQQETPGRKRHSPMSEMYSKSGNREELLAKYQTRYQ